MKFELKEGNKMKKLFVLLIALIGAYLIYSTVSNFGWLPFGNKGAQENITDNIKMIEINVSGMSTVIIPENRDSLKADLDGKGKVSVNKNGDKVEVTAKRKWFGWDWFPFSNKSELKIYIPEDYDQNMALDLGSGNLEFSGQSMNLDELALDLSSGNVDLNNLNVQTFNFDGSSGNIDIDKLTTKTGTFDLSSGNVSLKQYAGALDAELSSGHMTIQMDELTDDIEIEASSGRVNLDLPKNADFNLDGQVSSGKIENEFPLTNQTSDKKNINGTYGSGKYHLDLTVSSGSIHIH